MRALLAMSRRQCLYFLPLPQTHRSLRSTLPIDRIEHYSSQFTQRGSVAHLYRPGDPTHRRSESLRSSVISCTPGNDHTASRNRNRCEFVCTVWTECCLTTS